MCQHLSRFGEFYSDFVHQAVANSDEYNADNDHMMRKMLTLSP